jgi:hypothetical protein
MPSFPRFRATAAANALRLSRRFTKIWKDKVPFKVSLL